MFLEGDVAYSEGIDIRKTLKKKDNIVLASGVFDLVHYGHVYFLQGAKRAGGKNTRLIVVVARDKTIEKMKGRPPVLPEDQRRAIVEALKPVDKAILGHEEFDVSKMLKDIKPNIVAVGYDQTEIESDVKKIISREGLDVKVVRMDKFLASDLDSSSKIRSKIRNQ